MVDEARFQQQLDRLERVWRRLDAPVLQYLRPGLADVEIDRLIVSTGLTLPDELRMWWRWHDGSNDPGTDSVGEREIGPGGWLHLSLQEAIDLYHYHDNFFSEMATNGSLEEANLTWRKGLFPFSHAVARPNDVLAAQTLVDKNAVAPVLLRTFMGIEPGRGADSVGQAIQTWVDLLESGRYSVVDHFFETDPPGLIEQDPELRWLL